MPAPPEFRFWTAACAYVGSDEPIGSSHSAADPDCSYACQGSTATGQQNWRYPEHLRKVRHAVPLKQSAKHSLLPCSRHLALAKCRIGVQGP